MADLGTSMNNIRREGMAEQRDRTRRRMEYVVKVQATKVLRAEKPVERRTELARLDGMISMHQQVNGQRNIEWLDREVAQAVQRAYSAAVTV